MLLYADDYLTLLAFQDHSFLIEGDLGECLEPGLSRLL